MTKKKKTLLKKRKNFTIMLVPHDQSSLSKIKVPLWAVKAVALVVFLIAATSVYCVHTYVSAVEESQRLQNVEKINEMQADKIEELVVRTQKMEEEMKELNELDEKVREMVGLEPREEGVEEESDDLSFTDTDDVFNVREISRNNVNSSNSFADSGTGGPAPLLSRSIVNREGRGDYFDGEEVIAAVDEQLDSLQDEAEEGKYVLAELKEDVDERLKYLAAKPDYWPVNGRVTSGFGYRSSPFGGGIEFHRGLDISASHGTTIRAAGDGRVTYTGYRGGYGYVVTIRHGYGYVTNYAHCSSILVSPGETVTKGQSIARVGSSGRATGPHLHFEIEYNGEYIDPLKILR